MLRLYITMFETSIEIIPHNLLLTDTLMNGVFQKSN